MFSKFGNDTLDPEIVPAHLDLLKTSKKLLSLPGVLAVDKGGA